jgi:flagellar protein FliO/FliZ
MEGWLALGGLVAAVALLGAAVRRFSPRLGRSATGEVVRLGAVALSPQSSVAVVRVMGETLVVGVTPQQVSLLARLGAPAQEGGPQR